MSDVEGTGDIGRRYDYGKGRFFGIGIGVELPF
jgi:hypothetical protein